MMRILLVEDHKGVWGFLSRQPGRQGSGIVATMGGQRNVDRVRSEHRDVILLDMNLPVMDGWTVAGASRKGPSAASVPTVATTVYAMSGDREKAFAITGPLRTWLQPGGIPDGAGWHPSRSDLGHNRPK